MWQFMAATGRHYDLQVNAWIDDRMNPEKATRAAARHMLDLHRMFGDWHLALAAYNCGAGNVRKAQRRSGRTSFWDIYNYLPRETRNYVPMFIATSLVASNPSAFGLPPVEPGPRYAYHYVPVEGMLTLSDVAKLAGTTETTIRALNPEIMRSTLPPSRTAYYVRIPYGSHTRFIAGYEALPAVARASAVEHVVRRGDSLGRISKRHGITVASLMQANGLRSTTIHPGQRLAIPVPAYTSGKPPAAVEMGQVLAVDYGTRVQRPILVADAATEPQASTHQPPVVRASSERVADATPGPSRGPAASSRATVEESSPDTRVVYTVRRGDNLTTIAKRYGVTVGQLRGWNSLRGSTIHSGQRLTLYTNSDAPAAPATVAHVVRRGETLSGLASRYGTTVANIRQWNSLRSNNIRVGQRLTIHPKNAGPITHKVVKGDTLIDLARRYKVRVSDIRSWNNLRGNTIRVGQNLTIRT
ncbi:MAG: LysM peptidoglycan-binding domain-containing protein, partial [Bacteroidota bacterium]